jgi:branched-chain amino acid transport system substrate-binding protein
MQTTGAFMIFPFPFNALSKRYAVAVPVLVLLGALVGCSPAPPIAIGYLGGLSGKFADLGTASRNGALLAVEQTNDAGGVAGRKLELVEADDRQNNEAALSALLSLVERKVVAVVGPSTSSIAVAVVPVANDRRLVLVSPTGTTSRLTGKDDYFFRAVGEASFYGAQAARYHVEKLGVRSAALILDMANADYTESWGEAYAAEFKRAGGAVVALERFQSTQSPDHAAIARKLVASKPQAVVTVASSVDAALIAQRVKTINPQVRMVGASWASTERLIELGGAAVEGMLFEQYFDRFDTSPKYLAFAKAYRERFNAEPGYAALLAYDSASMVIAALGRTQKQEEMKSALLAIKTFEGVQDPVVIDAFGDVTRRVHYGLVRDGKFAQPD